MTDKKMIQDQQAEIDKLKQELQEMDKLKQELQERDAAEQERDAQHQVRQIEIDNLREQHEEAMNVIAKLNARATLTTTSTSTDLDDADASKPFLSMDKIVTLVQREIKNASSTDADSDNSGTESDSSYIGATSDTYDPDEFTAANTRYIERGIVSSLKRFENYDGREDRHGRLVFGIRAAFRNNNMPEIVDQKKRFYKTLAKQQPEIAKVQSRVMRSILGMLLTEGEAYVKYKAALRNPGNKTDSRGLWTAFTSAFILSDPDSAIDAIEAGIAALHWEGGH